MTTTEHTSTKQDILQHLLKRGEGTAIELAEALSITPQAIRRHLKNLELEDLIEYESVQQGMGRPQHIYKLSRTGRDRFPNRYSEFAVSFLDTLAETAGEEQVKAVLRKQWERKAAYYRSRLGNGALTQRLANLVKLRQEEGYMAEWFPVEAKETHTVEKYILYEHNCAISEVAESYPSVCGHELEMFAAVLPDCTVERTQWLNEGEHHCGYLIQAKAKI